MNTPTTFSDLVIEFANLINLIIGFLFAFAFVFLVWKMFDTWIIHADDEGKRDEGKQTAVVAVIVLVVLALVWGIVNIIRQSLFGS